MADGSRHSMAWVEEATYGTIPASPIWNPIRHKSTSLGLQKSAIESEEIRADRQTQDYRHGTRQVGGDVEMELTYMKYSTLVEAVLCGSKVPQRDTTATTLSATSAGTFTRGAGSFVTDSFSTTMVVVASGFTNAGNNGRFRVTAVAAGTLTVTPLDGQTMVNETGGGDERIVSERGTIKAGTTRRSFAIERLFGDMSGNKYHRFTGVEFTSLKLSVTPDKIAQLTLSTVGKDLALASAIVSGATYRTQQTTSPMVAFNATITEGGGATGVVTELQLTLENGIEPRFVVGSASTARPSIGRSKCSGQITVYFEDSTLLEKFINETESTLAFELFDTAGNSYAFSLPRIKYTGGQPDVKGEGPVTLSMPFVALYDTTAATQVSVEFKPV